MGSKWGRQRQRPDRPSCNRCAAHKHPGKHCVEGSVKTDLSLHVDAVQQPSLNSLGGGEIDTVCIRNPAHAAWRSILPLGKPTDGLAARVDGGNDQAAPRELARCAEPPGGALQCAPTRDTPHGVAAKMHLRAWQLCEHWSRQAGRIRRAPARELHLSWQ
jgi:hypothetical protein